MKESGFRHICATYDYSSDTLAFYGGGAAKTATVLTAPSNTEATGTGSLIIGGETITDTNKLNGGLVRAHVNFIICRKVSFYGVERLMQQKLLKLNRIDMFAVACT